jgi:hypothetical protein
MHKIRDLCGLGWALNVWAESIIPYGQGFMSWVLKEIKCAHKC